MAERTVPHYFAVTGGTWNPIAVTFVTIFIVVVLIIIVMSLVRGRR